MRIRTRSITAWVLAGMVAMAAFATHRTSIASSETGSASEHVVVDAIAAAGIKAEILLKADSSWDGIPYTSYLQGQPQVTVVRLTIPPHTVLPWHTHPMPNAAYVVSGQIEVQKQADGLKQTLRPGQTLAEMVDSPHRGVTGDEPTVLILFYAGVVDMPLSKGH